MKKLIVAVSAAAIVAGCATAPDNVTAAYVSPEQYADYSCRQIREEMIEVSQQVRGMADAEGADRRRDAVALTVGLVVFWPALAFMAEGDHKDELAGLKGDYEALKHEAIRKDCASLEDEMAADQARAQQQAQVAAASTAPALPVDATRPRCGTVAQPDGSLKIVPCPVSAP
jgi:hypothetical protein